MSKIDLATYDNSKNRPHGQDFFVINDPFVHFDREFKKAEELIEKDPNAMTLSTVSAQGFPSSRTVLFKGLVREGFSFYTNFNSQKSQELQTHPRASLLFFWAPMEQQIRIEGETQALTRAESEEYYRSRPRLSQIGAWASHQSEKIESLESLQLRVNELEKKYESQVIPCPPNWGGWHLRPLKMEFWFGRRGRLHERYVYQRDTVTEKKWQTSLLSP